MKHIDDAIAHRPKLSRTKVAVLCLKWQIAVCRLYQFAAETEDEF